MKTVDAIDGDYRFTTEWGGIRRYVFIARAIVNGDAGRDLSRTEGIEFIRKHLDTYRMRAEAQHGTANEVQMVELDRGE